METSSILQLLKNSGITVFGEDGVYIWIEDPTCFTRSIANFINEIAWPVIVAMTVIMIFGWGISLIRGAKTDIMANMRNLALVFGILSLAVPITNAIWGKGNLFGQGCKRVGVPIEEIQRILATRGDKLKSFNENELYEEFDIYDSASGRSYEEFMAEQVANGAIMTVPASTVVNPQETKSLTVAGGTYDGRIYGGMCTLPAQSRNFSNQYYTTGKYAVSDAAFDKAMNTVFRAEGGLANHKNDSGGLTKYGVAQNYNPGVDVKNITRADAENIAYTRYYKKYGIDKLPDAIRGDVFQVGWGTGPKVAVKQFQGILGVPKTGTVNHATVAAAQNYKGDLRGKFLESHKQYLQGIVERKPDQKVFQRGWMNRVELMRDSGCHS